MIICDFCGNPDIIDEIGDMAICKKCKDGKKYD